MRWLAVLSAGVCMGGLGAQEPVPPPVAGSPPAVTAAGPPAPAAEPAFTARWNHGLFFETADKSFTAHVGGTVHYDVAWVTAQESLTRSPGGTGPFADGATPRRLRLAGEGTIAQEFDYKLEFEFANGVLPNPGTNSGPSGVVFSPSPTDAWVQWKKLPVFGTLRVGNQKEPFALEPLESARFLPFLERAYLFDAGQPSAFNNGRSPGVQVFNTWADDRVYTAGGLFKNMSNPFGFGLGDGEYAATGRAGVLAVYQPDDPANRMLWLGGAASHRDPVADAVQVRIRNQIRNAPLQLLNLVANTGQVPVSSHTLYNLQTAAAYGSAWAQAEYLVNLLRDAEVGERPVGTARLDGFYVASGLLLTGERRTWNPKAAVWNRIVPKRNLRAAGDDCEGGGYGAWEMAARYSQFDASDQGIDGGRLRAVTLGLNWYWNPNMKVQFNYDYLYRDQAANPLAKGEVHSFGTRAAFDF